MRKDCPISARSRGWANSTTGKYRCRSALPGPRASPVWKPGGGGQLLLRGELPATEEIAAAFAAPGLSGAAAEESLVAVSAPQDYQVTFPESDRLERLSPHSLPAELIAEGRDSPVVFRLPGADAALRVEAGRRKGVDALAATCDSVNAISCMTE